jgi:hypothetical protein
MSTTKTQPIFADFIQSFRPSIFEHTIQQRTFPTATKRGRPKSNEFEDEVIAECERLLLNENTNCTMRKRTNTYSYTHVKNCAAIVMDREYWNEDTGSFVKKWQLNRTTNKLRFTNKWVFGVLRRHSNKTSLGSHSYSPYDVESVDSQDNDVSISTHFSSSSSVSSDHSDFHDLDLNQYPDVVSHEIDNSWLSAGTSNFCLDDDLFDFDFDWEL